MLTDLMHFPAKFNNGVIAGMQEEVKANENPIMPKIEGLTIMQDQGRQIPANQPLALTAF